MSNEQKVALARRAEGDHGLAPVLAALELPRPSWYYHQKHRRAYSEKYAHLREPLEAIAREHPEYGYWRTTVELREVHGYHINHKVVQKLHQEWNLPLIRFTPALPAPVVQAQVAGGARETENRSLLLDAQTLEELQTVIAERMGYHNGERRHSTIGY